MPLLWARAQCPQRFGELRRELPKISEKALTQQLREPKADGIVRHENFAQVRPKVEYSPPPTSAPA
ncbi:hypothetical protein Srufu_033260 [Streptomyces libani subsp. rufus]|nr:hypothetical protein Srufu_033260 [Streptomyces libani subsp. rufus]